MKPLKTILFALPIIFLLPHRADAQRSTGNHPTTISTGHRTTCSAASLEKLFSGLTDSDLDIVPGGKSKELIISRTTPNPNTISLNIHLNTTPGAMLHISKTKREDGSIQYAGTMLELHGITAWQLRQEDGNYFFEPVDQKLLIAE